MKIMYMSEDVDAESIFVKNVGFAVRSQACSKSISVLTLMSGLTYASYVTLPSKRKVQFSSLERKILFFFFFNGYLGF